MVFRGLQFLNKFIPNLYLQNPNLIVYNLIIITHPLFFSLTFFHSFQIKQMFLFHPYLKRLSLLRSTLQNEIRIMNPINH